MRKPWGWVLGLCLVLSFWLVATSGWASQIDLRHSDGTITPLGGVADSAKVNLTTGVDAAVDVVKVEQRFTCTLVTADTAVKSSAGLLHSITFSQNDAVPTAGTIIVYNNTAESGTQLFNWNVQITTFVPFTLIFDGTFSTGLFVGFTTTVDVNATVCYR